MSRKIDAFRVALPQPLTRKDITILSPQLAEEALIAQSVQFPTCEMQEAQYYVDGTPMWVPTKAIPTGPWVFDVPDSLFTPIKYHMTYLLYNKKKFNVTLVLGDLRDIIGGIVSLNPLSIMSSLIQSGVSCLSSASVLRGCWVKSIAPVDMSQSSPTEPVMWRVSCRYDYIKPFINFL